MNDRSPRLLGTAELALDEEHLLAEGPFWDAPRQQLLWVDILRGLVLRGRLQADGTIAVDDRLEFPHMVGAVASAESGAWIIAGQETLLYRRPDGELVDGPRVIPAGSNRRLNDGKPDPAGRYIIGTLDFDEVSETEELLVLGSDGRLVVIDSDLTLSNGLGWSSDGSRFFSTDTLRKTIYVRHYDPGSGAMGERKVFLVTTDGHPDGMTMDSDDHLWVAMWGIGRVNRYSPSGELVAAIEVPALQPSSVTFAGPDLATLVITTASKGLSEEQKAARPLSGRLFTFRPGVTGQPPALWAGPPPS
ncbi:SMP-30/gluconolactonase/LRE family protein [Naasia lichenicola]|uniref:SMP-30/gluconolactonase/LRE family protein n=1 Tax=Naasia lichenicola TaxID=2565933 RepID=A0A4S4FHT9_9MICO|nr:SMP-30/gluconolactonase/LRE family protein [Naasia lichenicola]THG28705.1 SMP-30/gluconolactonase/LRE family protein [Naasia lichenicola]